MTSPSVPTQEAAANAFANRDDLVRRILKEMRYRTYRVRATIGYDRLPDNELADYALSALGFGFYRALIEKFSAERGLNTDWWTEQRRETAGHGKDRTSDLQIILANFDDFTSFYVPLTDDEVVAAAKIEMYDMIAAAGTDYHQMEEQRKHTKGGELITAPGQHVRGHIQGSLDSPDIAPLVLDLETGDVDFIDPEAQEDVENVIIRSMLTDERDPLGPVITRVAAVAIREYGTNGLFWLLERVFLPTRYSEVLRAVGGNEEELGKTEFERIKRDMVRKLPEVHERMMTILRDDPDMQELRDLLWTKRAVAAPVDARQHQTVTQERERYIERHRTRLLRRLEWEGESGLAESLSGLTAAEITPCVHEYVKAINDTNPDAWPLLKGKLARVFEVKAA